MPATRTKKSGAMKQSTLSFASKRTSSAANITSKTKTRPSSAITDDSIELTSSSSSSSDDEIESIDPEEVEVKVDITKNVKKEMASGKGTQKATPISVVSSEKRPQLRLNDKRWNKVWNHARSKMDNLQPIHGEEDNKFHQILRVFDMSYEYGPCVGVTRLERWERASSLGLNPPVEIRDILLTQQGMEDKRLANNVLYEFQV
ncbi:hypothetical protein K435DRAFT_779659 [Dendrothele bispora CBS 962.96]|uniref:DNA polymerase delta, subunit 4 n=1 Tax=Dendrothele bispora (strain CBS 962.96) TaxID=1314807 RepID=A0A4V4HF75_DENBC|nr:hypothetical protein K435DRAFT_779659 [Dendrothele bispora CBS 962.96]